VASPPDELRAALDEAHLPTLLMAMATLSGDDSWLREEWRPAAPRGAEEDNTGGLAPEAQAEIRAAALELILAWRAGKPAAAPPPPERLLEMLEIALGPGTTLPPTMAPLLAEELGVASRDVHLAEPPSAEEFHVVVIGGGFGGLCAGIKLKAAGIAFTILEKNDELGGTWLENTYPGCAVDTPSHLYSFSFAQRRHWERLCPTQADILTYVREVVAEQELEEIIETGTRVTACRWDDATRRWTVETSRGERSADAVIVATGQLHQPAVPRLAGEFAGHSFHSAAWDHGYDLRGKRVAVIGTGASAVQFVPPVAEQAAHTTVFQRTGNWFLPRRNRAYPRAYHWLIEHVPGFQTARRTAWFWIGESLTFAIRHPRTVGGIYGAYSWVFMRRQLKDHPQLRERIWPDYTFGCKRVLFSSTFLPTLARPDVEVVTDPIERLAPEGVVTCDGRVHAVDCVIYGTGFRTTDFMFPMEVTGAGGRSLAAAWAQGAHAHLGITVPGFPSLYLMYGPNTNTSGGSIITYHEAQAAYIRQAIELQRDRDAALAVRAAVEAASDRAVQERFAGTAWTRCDSWYRDDSGRIVTNWPGYMREYLAQTRRLDPADFELVS
jgi:cation diffusion facilitator CzcD-associated flavoprotein CzcO